MPRSLPFFVLVALIALPSLAEPPRPSVGQGPSASAAPPAVDPIARWSAAWDEGSRPKRWQALRELAQLGPAGVAEAARLVAALADPVLAEQAERQLRHLVQPSIVDALVEGRLDGAQALLEALAAGADADSLRDLAAFLATSGREPSPAVRTPALEAWTSRARGELLSAETPLKALPRDRVDRELLRAAAFDSGDWHALAGELLAGADASTEAGLKELGAAAAALRLVGDEATADRVAATLAEAGRERPEVARTAAAILVLLERPESAEALLLQTAPVVVFDGLVAEARVAEALDLARGSLEGPDRLEDKALSVLQLKVARTLLGLGDRAGARVALDRYVGLVSDPDKPESTAGQVVYQEHRLGFDEAARARAAATLDELPAESASRVLWGLFSAHRDEAAAAWAWLALDAPALETAERLRLVEAILDEASKEGSALRGQLLADAPTLLAELEGSPLAERTRGLAGLSRLAGDEAAAEGLLRRWAEGSDRPDAWTALGESLADAGRWEAAAEAFGRAFEAKTQDPAPLGLKAWALERAGRVEEARATLELGSLVALGDGGRRWALAGSLSRHGLATESRLERELLLLTTTPTSWHQGAVLRQLSASARCGKRAAEALDHAQKAVVQALLREGPVDPLTAAGLVRIVRDARVEAAVADGRLLEAVALSEGELAPWLARLGRTAAVARALEDEGHVAEASWLADRVLLRLGAAAKECPEDANALNRQAWFASRVRRDLAEARAAAERATALRPDSASCLDTLAEVHFQLGDAERAIELEQEALALEPESEYLRAQLQRFREGDPSTSPPSR
jgi:tetratricopeptide (TPR) repeat protein